MAAHERLVVPGRFQPPHRGHAHLVRYTLGLAREAVVVVGSAQASHTLDNPLTAGERVELLRLLLEEELGEVWKGRVYIVPVMDIKMNAVWVHYLKMLLPRFEGVVSGNPLVRILFEEAGFKAYKPPLYERSMCSGRKIRDAVLRGDPSWSGCIPSRVLGALENLGFEKRLRRLAESDEQA